MTDGLDVDQQGEQTHDQGGASKGDGLERDHGAMVPQVGQRLHRTPVFVPGASLFPERAPATAWLP